MREQTGDNGKVLAWDFPTRAFKWTLAALVVSAWASNKFGGGTPNWHKWTGYAILVLIVFRLLWGFVGGSTARFINFVRGPGAALSYGLALLQGRTPKYLGHNPLGGAMVMAILAALAAQGALGLYAGDADRLIIDGPLARTVSDEAVTFAARWHHRVFDMLKILIVLHVMANLYYAFVKREPLIRGMATGYKPSDAYVDAPAARAGSPMAAVACLIASVVIVFGGILALGGRIVI
jgi:cytochrome b